MKWLVLVMLFCLGDAALAQTMRNIEPQPKSLVKILIVWVLGYEDPPSPMRVMSDKVITNLAKGSLEPAITRADAPKKRADFRSDTSGD